MLGALSHFLIVLRDSRVSFAMALVENYVAQFYAPNLAYYVHGNHLLLLLKNSAGQWNPLVNFESVFQPLAGQLSVDDNICK